MRAKIPTKKTIFNFYKNNYYMILVMLVKTNLTRCKIGISTNIFNYLKFKKLSKFKIKPYLWKLFLLINVNKFH